MKRISDYYDDEYQYYTSIDDVIEEVKASGEGGWIWENGKIRDDVFVCDVLEVLEGMKRYETQLDEETFNQILEEGEGDNTYNWAANISNDINIYDLKGVGCVMKVHLGGDIRGNYSCYFSVTSWEDIIYDGDLEMQWKPINERYSADMYAFTEGFEVYDKEVGDNIGQCYAMELEDVLKWIEENAG